jgi:hypothetical protein
VASSVNADLVHQSEVWEYIGHPGGRNEFIVRGRHVALINTGQASGTVAIAGVVDQDKCIPFITGISCNVSDGGARGTALVEMTSLVQAKVYVGGNSGRVSVYFVVVEFTGANWSVGHGALSSSADSGTIDLVDDADGTSGSSFDVDDWDTACIFGQHRGDSLSDTNQAISDNWPLFYPNADTDKVDYLFNAQHVGASNIQMVHVLKHAKMDVQRMTSTSSVGAINVDVAIPSTISDLAQAFAIVSRISSGTGQGYGRGWVNCFLGTVDLAKLWAHKSGNTVETRIQVVDLSGIPIDPLIEFATPRQLTVGAITETDQKAQVAHSQSRSSTSNQLSTAVRTRQTSKEAQ